MSLEFGYREIEDGEEYLPTQAVINLVRAIELEKSVVLIKTFLTENKAYASYFYGELGINKDVLLLNLRKILNFHTSKLNQEIHRFGINTFKRPKNLFDLIDQFNQANPISELDVTKDYLNTGDDETVGSLRESVLETLESFNKIYTLFKIYFSSDKGFENESFKYIISALRYVLCRFYTINDDFMTSQNDDCFEFKIIKKLGNSPYPDFDSEFNYVMEIWNVKLRDMVIGFLGTDPLVYINTIHDFKQNSLTTKV